MERELRDYLFHVNEGLVLSIARTNKNKHPDIDFDDLVQEGNEGMLRAMEDFNPDLGIVFPHTLSGGYKKYVRNYTQKSLVLLKFLLM